jgi:hypothetical protein
MRSLKLLVSAVFLMTSITGTALAAGDTKHKKTTEQTVSKKHGAKSSIVGASKGKHTVVANNQKRKHKH